MSQELQQALFDKYPAIFAERFLPTDQSAMSCGIECHDGWFHLVDVLCDVLQAETDAEGAPQIIAVQVKEKFGRLRFRIRGFRHGASVRQWAMIRFAEALSERTCEVCGAPVPEPPYTREAPAGRCMLHRNSR